MYIKKISWLIFLSLIIISLPACLNGNDDDDEVSDDPTLASLSFGENDSIPNLEDAVFTIDDDNRLVYNEDSLPFQTRIDSVFPTFTFNNPSAGAILYCGDDTIVLTGSDTVDFSKQPIRLLNYAENGIDTIWYTIHVNVHQVDPELYVWNKLNEEIYTHEGSNQKAIWFNEKIYLFVSSGLNNYLYTSSNGDIWTKESTPSGLPEYNDFHYMVEYNGTLYLVQGINLYTSTNGVQWTAHDMSGSDFSFINLLFAFNEQLWGIVQSNTDNTYHFAYTANGTAWTIGTELPENFPINDFAAISFLSRTNRPKALVMGGYSAENGTLNTRWTTEDGAYWINFSIEQPSFGSLAGAAIVSYNDKLLIFGGVDSNNHLIESHLLETLDEGLNWLVPDTASNVMPVDYALRTRQSAIVNESDHRIYIVGGQTRTEVFKDIWTGKVNKLGFADVE